MCLETLIYGAKYFLTQCTYNNQTNFFEVLVKGRFRKCILLPTGTLNQSLAKEKVKAEREGRDSGNP